MIVTVTANAALDRTLTVPVFQIGFRHRSSDVLTVHLVLGDRTRGVLGRHEIGLMRPTAFLVNTARSALVDTDALVEALQENRIAGAGLDVFDQEPLPAEHVLRTLPNVLATPHLGYVARDNYRTYFTEAVEDIAAYLAGKPIRVLTARPPGARLHAHGRPHRAAVPGRACRQPAAPAGAGAGAP